MPGTDLRKLYTGMVRSVIGYSSVTYGPMLTKFQDHELENIQKRCLRIMYGYDKSYIDLLRESGLETLKVRRENALPRFVKNAINNPVYSSWFQENQNPRQSQRNPRKYEEKFARSNRLYNSPLYTARRLLNDSSPELPEQELAFDHNLNDPFAF